MGCGFNVVSVVDMRWVWSRGGEGGVEVSEVYMR